MYRCLVLVIKHACRCHCCGRISYRVTLRRSAHEVCAIDLEFSILSVAFMFTRNVWFSCYPNNPSKTIEMDQGLLLPNLANMTRSPPSLHSRDLKLDFNSPNPPPARHLHPIATSHWRRTRLCPQPWQLRTKITHSGRGHTCPPNSSTPTILYVLSETPRSK